MIKIKFITILSPAILSAFFAAAILFLFPWCLNAQNERKYTLTAESLENNKAAELDDLEWKYRAGDDSGWAAKEFDDGGWKLLTNDDINSDPRAALENWNGRAWFRLRIDVDESIVNRVLAWRMWHWGASEIYVDGKLVQSYGSITPSGDTEFNPRGVFFPVVFNSGGEHTIAVRYSFDATSDLNGGLGRWLTRGRHLPGFRLHIESAENAALQLESRARNIRLFYVFVGIFFALALVHFLLFIFYRNAPSNLFYSLFVCGIALSFWLQNMTTTEHFGAAVALLTDIVRLNVQSLAVLSLLAFLYVEFIGRVSRFFWMLLGLWLVSIFLHSAQVWQEIPYTVLMLFLTLADCLRIMVRALAGRRDGAWIIAVGVGLLAVGVANNISVEREFVDIPDWLYQLNLYLTVLAVPLAVSVYLARNFARTNRCLEAQLAQVQELSARQLEHERTEAELRLQNEKERAENERRAKELEEARQLQMSMLPKKLPQVADLEIAAYIKPASEVGGDYYDFHVDEDGTLTVAVGDATGHGLKAGTMVTATKSLFNNLAHESDIGFIFKQSSAALKKMNLRGMFMAMTMAKIKDHRLIVSCAGMPSILIYRESFERTEEIAIKAMPLGSPFKAAYEQRELALSAGDTILLMSDGFPELFNEAGEMLGFEKAKMLFSEIANESASEIIRRLVQAGEQWGATRPADDDVTFVVLKIRSATSVIDKTR